MNNHAINHQSRHGLAEQDQEAEKRGIETICFSSPVRLFSRRDQCVDVEEGSISIGGVSGARYVTCSIETCSFESESEQEPKSSRKRPKR